MVRLEAACRHVLNRLAGAEPEMRNRSSKRSALNVHADNLGAVIEGSPPTLDPVFAPGEAVADVRPVVSTPGAGIRSG